MNIKAEGEVLQNNQFNISQEKKLSTCTKRGCYNLQILRKPLKRIDIYACHSMYEHVHNYKSTYFLQYVISLAAF